MTMDLSLRRVSWSGILANFVISEFWGTAISRRTRGPRVSTPRFDSREGLHALHQDERVERAIDEVVISSCASYL